MSKDFCADCHALLSTFSTVCPVCGFDNQDALVPDYLVPDLEAGEIEEEAIEDDYLDDPDASEDSDVQTSETQ
jgi:hypothetical protein